MNNWLRQQLSFTQQNDVVLVVWLGCCRNFTLLWVWGLLSRPQGFLSMKWLLEACLYLQKVASLVLYMLHCSYLMYFSKFVVFI